MTFGIINMNEGDNMDAFTKVNIKYYIDEEMELLIKEIDDNLSKIKITNQKRDNLITKAMIRSIHSSVSIEANPLSLLDVKKILEEKEIIGDKKDIEEIKNTIEVYNNIDKYDYKSEKDFLKAHQVIINNISSSGYRDHGEAVKMNNQIIYMAPDSLLVPELINSLFLYLNTNKINKLVLSAIFHYYLVSIHPFSDGNGRIARFWMNLILISYNNKFKFIPVDEEIYLNSEDYYKAIKNSHINGNANVFIKFILKMINDSILKTIINIGFVLNDMQNKIIDLIANNGKITQREISKVLGVSERTVKRNFKILIDNNIIKRIGSDKTGSWEINY